MSGVQGRPGPITPRSNASLLLPPIGRRLDPPHFEPLFTQVPGETVRKGVRATLRAWIWSLYGTLNGPKSTVLVVRKATVQAPPKLFGQFRKRDSRKFADAEECVTGILSLPNVLLGHEVRGGPYEESDRIGDRVIRRRRRVAGEVTLPILQRRDERGDPGSDGRL